MSHGWSGILACGPTLRTGGVDRGGSAMTKGSLVGLRAAICCSVISLVSFGCSSSSSRAGSEGVPPASDPRQQAAQTTSDPSGADQPVDGPTSSAPSSPAESKVRPLDTLLAFPEQDDRVVWAANERAMHVCAAASGIDYPESPYPEGGNVDFMSAMYPPSELVEEYGYRWAAAGPVPPTPPAADVEWSENDLRILGACADATVDTLKQRALAEFQRAFSEANGQILVTARVNAEVVAATEAWSRCMASQGFEYSSPQDAVLDARSAPTVDDPRSIQIAVFDYECRRQNMLGEIEDAVVADLQQAWLEAHVLDIEEARNAMANQLELSKAFLAEHPA